MAGEKIPCCCAHSYARNNTHKKLSAHPARRFLHEKRCCGMLKLFLIQAHEQAYGLDFL